MNILEKILALISVLLLILCMLAPLKRAELAQKHPWIRHVTGFHAVYGVILLATGLAHGILAGSGPAMMTGKLGWMLLLILTLLTPLKKKNKTGCLAQDTYCTRSSSMCTYGRAYCSVDYYVTWLSPHARTGSSRIEQRVPRFRFASSRSWLSPHRKEEGEPWGNASTSPWLSSFFSALLNA